MYQFFEVDALRGRTHDHFVSASQRAKSALDTRREIAFGGSAVSAAPNYRAKHGEQSPAVPPKLRVRLFHLWQGSIHFRGQVSGHSSNDYLKLRSLDPGADTIIVRQDHGGRARVSSRKWND
jgi:hypothetical protein